MKPGRTVPLANEEIEPQTCGIDLRLKILRRVPFLAPLSANELEQVNRHFHERDFAAGETIYFVGDPASRLYVVASGKVKLTSHTPSGKDVLLDILAPGDFFGSLSALGNETYSETAQAQTFCCVLGIATEDFQDVLHRYASVASEVLSILAARLREAHDTIQQLSSQSVESRVAATLLKLADKLGEERRGQLLIQVPLSRQDLAEMTGTSTETVSRIMSQFRREGLIRSGRRWIAVVNRDRLAAVSRESER